MLKIRKVSSDKVFLHEESQVKFKTAGNTREVQFSEGVNNKCPIKNITKDIYRDKVTGEIKKRKHNENRFQSPKSVHKSINRLMHYNQQLNEIDSELEKMYHDMGCILTTIPGISTTTAVKILAETGDIHRFGSTAKLAKIAGIAPKYLSSEGKGKDKASEQGNKRLKAILYFLSVQMIQTSSKGTPRNPVFRKYYEKRIAAEKISSDRIHYMVK